MFTNRFFRTRITANFSQFLPIKEINFWENSKGHAHIESKLKGINNSHSRLTRNNIIHFSRYHHPTTTHLAFPIPCTYLTQTAPVTCQWLSRGIDVGNRNEPVDCKRERKWLINQIHESLKAH